MLTMNDYVSYHDYILRRIKKEYTDGKMIYESKDGGQTVTQRPSKDHPIHLLTQGSVPVDIWYKIFKK